MPKDALNGRRVYCAGPLFNQAERSEMEAIADRLIAAGHRVYVPHRDGMEFRLILEILVERGWAAPQAAEFLHAAIFALDVYQLAVECDSMVWNLNGRTPDEGAVSEAAMAWTLGKPIVAYKDDVRSLIAGRVNPLLVGMVDFLTVEDVDAIPEALQRAIAEHSDAEA
ncbi:MAG: nucleoside 2-deoxyribosyltransferase, partial [Planctomycetaceae bacterium]